MPRVRIDMSPSTLDATSEPNAAVGGLGNLATAVWQAPQQRAQIEQQRERFAWEQQHQQRQDDLAAGNAEFEHGRQDNLDAEARHVHAWEQQHGDAQLAETGKVHAWEQAHGDAAQAETKTQHEWERQHGDKALELEGDRWDAQADWHNQATEERKNYHAGQLQLLHEKIAAGKANGGDLTMARFHARQLAVHQAESEAGHDDLGHRRPLDPKRVDQLEQEYMGRVAPAGHGADTGGAGGSPWDPQAVQATHPDNALQDPPAAGSAWADSAWGMMKDGMDEYGSGARQPDTTGSPRPGGPPAVATPPSSGPDQGGAPGSKAPMEGRLRSMSDDQLDAYLQGSDPAYAKARANPRFNLKKALAAARAGQ